MKTLIIITYATDLFLNPCVARYFKQVDLPLLDRWSPFALETGPLADLESPEPLAYRLYGEENTFYQTGFQISNNTANSMIYGKDVHNAF